MAARSADLTLARELRWLRRLRGPTLARAYGVLLDGARASTGRARVTWTLLAETAAQRLGAAVATTPSTDTTAGDLRPVA